MGAHGAVRRTGHIVRAGASARIAFGIGKLPAVPVSASAPSESRLLPRRVCSHGNAARASAALAGASRVRSVSMGATTREAASIDLGQSMVEHARTAAMLRCAAC
eukprot:CAMPEP_0183335050 /NCGR_PEP_ID=MMETSP0164_2-20130417/3462_1 /TAXON_ID=221442 /ORGANISM="Coccolithus pelagicus ssp braarudi, Strain PLY182g" /LENGTH=104 /DNA_ID=CAMNT_0025504321 /DNA_START=563 /DNA_END=877 /DNA_ORIENTATION=-